MKISKVFVWLTAAAFVLSVHGASSRANVGSFVAREPYKFSVDEPLFLLGEDLGTQIFTPWLSHDADTLVLSCMDFRLISRVSEYMDKISKKGSYDYVVLAGASLGVNNTVYPDWGRTFWDHLKLSRDLHNIRNVMIIDHRNCGAYKAILHEDYPESETASQRKEETASHKKQLEALAQAIHEKYPFLGVQTRLMSLDGSVEDIGDLKGDGTFPDHQQKHTVDTTLPGIPAGAH
jgi:hypothetical protein